MTTYNAKVEKSQAAEPFAGDLVVSDLPRHTKVAAGINHKDGLTTSSAGSWDGWFNGLGVSEDFMLTRDQPQPDAREQF